MAEEFPPVEHTPDDEVLEVEFVPYDFDPKIRAEIDKRSQGGRVLSYLVSNWREAVVAATEHPNDAQYSDKTAEAMNAVEDMLQVLGITRTEQAPPAQEGL